MFAECADEEDEVVARQEVRCWCVMRFIEDCVIDERRYLAYSFGWYAGEAGRSDPGADRHEHRHPVEPSAAFAQTEDEGSAFGPAIILPSAAQARPKCRAHARLVQS